MRGEITPRGSHLSWYNLFDTPDGWNDIWDNGWLDVIVRTIGGVPVIKYTLYGNDDDGGIWYYGFRWDWGRFHLQDVIP